MDAKASPYIYPGLTDCSVITTLEGILKSCCDKSGFSTAIIIGRSRKREHVIVRQIYCYLAHTQTKNTLGRIGSFINRDHSTVLWSINQSKLFLDVKDKEFMICYKMIAG